jgi:hypothetical protein
MRSTYTFRRAIRYVQNVVTVITMGTFLTFSLGCSRWTATPITDVVVIRDDKLIDKDVYFYLADGSQVTMHVGEVDYPFVRGMSVESDVRVQKARVRPFARDTVDVNKGELEILEVDLRDVTKMEIEKANTGQVVALLGCATIMAVLVAVIAGDGSSSSSSSSSSCPVLYVQDGDSNRLVGEPYAGAAAGSIQRRDMMPLPALPEGRAQLLLANEARETQYTDFAELVIVDHEPGVRAVATLDQEVILVSGAQAPVRAVDISGADVTASVEHIDGVLWQTDLSVTLGATKPPLAEELTLAFPRPALGERPVLELEIGNTYWLDMVMNRFFALMGDDFAKGMEKANQKSAGPRIKKWIAREGVDLTVEWQGPDGWSEVGHVSSVGPLALRHVAVPLPSTIHTSESSEITLRIRGGMGFWKVDQVGLSTVRSENVDTWTVSPDVMRDDDGTDQRELVSATDGRYQVLAEIGDKAYLEFDVPPAVPELTRSVFFHSNGYYVAHKPIQSKRSVSTLKTILDEEGALARFSLDLCRKYDEIALNAPR